VRRISHALLAVAAAFTGGCRDARPSPASSVVPDTTDVALARAAATALGRDLVAMLTRELTRGGPVAAIAVCADSAQERTQQHQANGVLVRRVGTRVRNPLNAPDALEQAVLDRFAATIAAGGSPADTTFVADAPGGAREVRFLRPVRVQELCLACHGAAEQITPEVRQIIATRYPGDQATGYAVGELRGAVTARLTLPRSPAE